MCCQRLNCWKTIASFARMRSTCFMSAGAGAPRRVPMRISSPLTRTSPLFGVSSRLMQRRNVDLPEPDEPRIATTSWSCAVSEMPFSTSCAPYDLWIVLDVERHRRRRRGSFTAVTCPSAPPLVPRPPRPLRRISGAGPPPALRPPPPLFFSKLLSPPLHSLFPVTLRPGQSKPIAPPLKARRAAGVQRRDPRRAADRSPPAALCYSPPHAGTGLCRDCLTARGGPGRCPACRSPRSARPPRARHARDRPSRLRRLLRRGREARHPALRDRPVIVGGGAPRRRRHRLLHRAHHRRPLGDADVQGAEALPRGGGGPPADGPLRRGRPRDARDDAGADAAGRAAVARRGLPRPLRHRAAAPRAARGAARPAAGAGSSASSASPPRSASSHNKFLAKIASDLDKPRGFAADRPRRDRRLPGAAAGLDHLGRRPRRRRARSSRGHPHHRRPARAATASALIRRFGSLGDRLWRLARGEDARAVRPDQRSSRSRTRPPSTRTPPTSTRCAGTSGRSPSRSRPAPRPASSPAPWSP